MKIKLLFVLLLLSKFGLAQNPKAAYSAPISGHTNGWNELTLPIEIYGGIQDLNFTNLRLWGVDDKKDTIETPYYIEQSKRIEKRKQVNAKLLNQVKKGSDFYYTFQVSKAEPLNQILLDFKNINYDWLLNIESSNDQQNWFTALENYRILDIQNQQTSYTFNTVYFKELKYTYVRITIRNPSETPELKQGSVFYTEVKKGKNYSVKPLNIKTTVNAKAKTSELNFNTEVPVPLNSIDFSISSPYDYYRKASLQFLKDSYLLKEKWTYVYATLWTGSFSSLEKDLINFNGPIAKKYKLIIENEDNPPLAIGIEAMYSDQFILKCQLDSNRKYYLTYGNTNLNSPNYDIIQFKDGAPDNMTKVKIGQIQKINSPIKPSTNPINFSKIWLWVLMIFIIIALSWFSYKMLKGN